MMEYSRHSATYKSLGRISNQTSKDDIKIFLISAQRLYRKCNSLKKAAIAKLSTEHRGQKIWDQILTLLFASCMTLNKRLNLIQTYIPRL
jgi:hypothetical protein